MNIPKMKSYKVSIVVTKTMWVTEEDFREDDVLGQEFDESAAINYAKGTLIEEIRNNPNRGTAKIMAIYDHETKELKTRRERL